MYNEIPAFLRPGFKKRPSRSGNPFRGLGAYRPWLSLWATKLTLILGWYRKPRIGRLPEALVDSDFLELLGIEPFLVDEDGDIETHGVAIRKISNGAIELRLLTRLEDLEEKRPEKLLPLFSNIERLGNILGLTDTDKAVFLLAATFALFSEFSRAISGREEHVSNDQLVTILGKLTGLPEKDFRQTLNLQSTLLASGLVTVDSSISNLSHKLSLMDGLGGRLLQSYATDSELTGQFLKPVAVGTLTLDAYPHLKSDIAICMSFLEAALKARTPGCNLFFYGTPGTGKTELTVALAKALGVEIYEVAFADEDGDPIRGSARLRAYSLCQRLLARRSNAILMFDEIEDVFPSNGGLLSQLFGGSLENAKAPGKAWVNRTLENNPVPAIWITNDPVIDPAYLRRFDFSTRFPIPPQKVRLQIARHHLEEFNPPEDWLLKITANEAVSPAQFNRAAKVARHASSCQQISPLAAIEQTLDRSMTLLNQKRQPPRNAISTGYDLQFLNTDSEPHQLLRGLSRSPSANVCFYGPPGTGKTELARFIADELGKPLMVRRASDILSMWVGESEKQIAQMFSDARQQDAVLVLDEADSFLADRRGASKSWEVTQVNELLTQMEAFEGIFIATTNLLDRLDLASLRRFSVKVKFEYLRSDQTWKLFLQEFDRINPNDPVGTHMENEVKRLQRVSPGDFSALNKQFRLWDTPPSACEFLEHLRREISAKGCHGTSIGFTN